MLDAGCGSHGCSLSEIPDDVHVVGVDLNCQNIKKSRRLTGSNFSFVRASLAYLPFRQEIFDIIICIDVLEHIEAKTKAVSELSLVANANGHFIGSTSNLLNPVGFFDSCAPTFMTRALITTYAGIGHYERHGRLTPSALTRIFRSAGFRVRALLLIGFPPFMAWRYESPSAKLPWYAQLWIIFDMLTEAKPLVWLKETVVYEAVKTRDLA